MINGTTKLLCVVGTPVRHSLSPYIHNTFASETGEDYVYIAFDVAAGSLADFVKSVHTLEIAGFNVTMPHKISVMEFLDELDTSAAGSGSVNTVVNRGGRLIGYNTDGAGAVISLERVISLSGKTAIVIGSGGAAKSAVYALKNAGSNVFMIARNGADSLPWSQLAENSKTADVVINATPLGMNGGEKFNDFTFLDYLKDNAVVFDYVYSPLKTRLLEEAMLRGLQTINGLYLLVYQAVYAWELFTGIKPASHVVGNVLNNIMLMSGK